MRVHARHKRARGFAGNRAGNFAMTTALVAPVLLGVIGGTLDFITYLNHQKGLQQLADGAALAAAREAGLKGWDKTRAEAVADSFLAQAKLAYAGSKAEITAAVTINETDRKVTIAYEQNQFGYFVAGYFKADPQIRVEATAVATGQRNLCVIAWDGSAANTLEMADQSAVTAGDCAVYSNSVHSNGLTVASKAMLATEFVCTAGGYSGSAGSFSTAPVTDCPPLEDPLASRPAPLVSSACKETGLAIKNETRTLSPGVYCGGIDISSNADITLDPGIYVIKDGPLVVDSNSSFTGKGVGLYFTGANATISFRSNAVIDLEAPVSGPMAGLLMFQDRASAEIDFKIESKKASNLLGTIYLPRGTFYVGANNKIAESSAYTAIVARRVKLDKKPDLVLNTNYGATAVPVPAGVGPTTGAPRLER